MDDIRTQIKAVVDNEVSNSHPDVETMVNAMVDALFSTFKDIYVENYYHALNQGVAQGIRMARQAPERATIPSSTEDGEPQPLPGKKSRPNGSRKSL